MIPLRDEGHKDFFPLLTILLIVINVLVFLYQAFLGPRGYEIYVHAYGLIPARLTRGVLDYQLLHLGGGPPEFHLVSSMFMHGGIMHLLGNMWFLWIFADNLEDELGRGRFMIYYVVTGIIATLAHVASAPSSTIPLVGASGAIAGVLGGYFVLFPRHKILTLIPLGFYITTARLPAGLFLGFWFLLQLLYSMGGGNVAWFAHIGGFIAGVLLVKVFRPRTARR